MQVYIRRKGINFVFQLLLLNIIVLTCDILAVSIMGGVGTLGVRYFVYLMREDDLKNLRYIWVPNIIGAGFFFALIMGLFINDVFGTYHSPFYLEIHSFLLVGSIFFGLGMFRFIKTIKSHLESKEKAEASLAQMQMELRERLHESKTDLK